MSSEHKNTLTPEQLKKYEHLTNEDAISLFKESLSSPQNTNKNLLTPEESEKFLSQLNGYKDMSLTFDGIPKPDIKGMREKSFPQNTNDNSLKNK